MDDVFCFLRGFLADWPKSSLECMSRVPTLLETIRASTPHTKAASSRFRLFGIPLDTFGELYCFVFLDFGINVSLSFLLKSVLGNGSPSLVEPDDLRMLS